MNNNVSFDAMLKMAAAEAMYRQLDSFPSKKELENMFSPSKALEDKMNKLIRKESRSDKLARFNRQFSKVAVIMLMVFTVTFTPLISAKAVRESIVETIIEWRDEFASIFFKSEAEPAVINDVKIGYMVEGFEENTNIYQNKYAYRKTFELGPQHINIAIYSKHNISSHIDNEYSDYYSIVIAGNDGIWIYRENNSKLIISNNMFIYCIDGNTDIGNLIEIYKNIEIS